MPKPHARSRTDRRKPDARDVPREPRWLRQLRSLEVPAVAEPLDLRRAWPHVLGVFALVLALYAATAARTVCFEDDGLFILSARSLGIPQPPGYPLVTILGKLASLVPLGTLAYRVHLASAVCGAATCAVLWLVLQLLFRDRLAAWAGALLYGVSAELWSQSIIAEVYSLNTLFFFGVLYLALDFNATRRPRSLWLLSALYGLSLANSWPLMGLSTLALALVLVPRWREIVPRLLPLALLSLACAALPYAWMVWRSHQHPEISFYGPIRSVHDLWYFLSRQGFGDVDVSETATAADRWRLLGHLGREAVRQFTPAGAALAAVGCWAQWRRWPRALSWALLAGFLGSTLLLAFLLAFDYDALFRSVVRVYPLIPWGIEAIWLVLGGQVLLERLRRPPPWARGAGWAALVALALLSNLRGNQRSGETFARDYGRAVLGSLEPNAVLFTHGDMDAFPLAYVHLAEGVRPDVEVYNDQGLLFENRLFDHDASPDERQRELAAFLRGTSRPVYFVDSSPMGFALQDGGLYLQVRKDAPAGQRFFAFERPALDFLDRMEAETSTDAWTLLRRDELRRRFARVLAYFKKYEPARFQGTEMASRYERLAATPQGIVGALELLILPDKDIDLGEVKALAAAADAGLGEDSRKGDRAFPAFALAEAQRVNGNAAAAEASYLESIRIYPSHQNAAVMALIRMYVQTGRGFEAGQIVNTYLRNKKLGAGMTAELDALKAKVDP